MRVLLIAVLTLGWIYSATVWSQANGTSDCIFHIKEDIENNMMITKTDGQVMQQNKGEITLKAGDKIAVTCSENISFRMIVECVEDKQFRTLDAQTINIDQLTCVMNTQPKLKEGNCLGTKSLIQIGFNNANSLVEQIEVCFDDATKQTLYAKMVMSKGIDDRESQTIERPPFRADDTFIKEPLKNLYDKQQKTFENILGKKLSQKVNIGHLVAWADFPYSVQRLLTMFYVNTAPQWKIFNSGNWNELEKRIRKTNKNNDYDVYTGTYGILELKGKNSNENEMYLNPATKENPIPQYPIPQYFWKVLIEKTEKPKGIAFIGRNNVLDPYIANEDILCTNVLQTITWLNSYKSWGDFKKGRIIACEVNDFKELWRDDLPDFPAVPGGLPLGNLMI